MTAMSRWLIGTRLAEALRVVRSERPSVREIMRQVQELRRKKDREYRELLKRVRSRTKAGLRCCRHCEGGEG